MLLLKVFNFYFFSVYKIWSLIVVQAGPELLNFIKYYICVCARMCVCCMVHTHAQNNVCFPVEVRGQFSPSPCGSKESNSGYKAFWQAPLSADPLCPCISLNSSNQEILLLQPPDWLRGGCTTIYRTEVVICFLFESCLSLNLVVHVCNFIYSRSWGS